MLTSEINRIDGIICKNSCVNIFSIFFAELPDMNIKYIFKTPYINVPVNENNTIDKRASW